MICSVVWGGFLYMILQLIPAVIKEKILNKFGPVGIGKHQVLLDIAGGRRIEGQGGFHES